MKKGVKITIIALCSTVGLLIAAIGIVLLSVFSPARLTKIVNQEAPKWIAGQLTVERVELTLFKTFPRLGLDIQHVTLINPMFGAPSDTLLSVEHCVAAINLRKLIRDNHIEVKTFQLQNGRIHLYTNKIGQSNYNVLLSNDNTSSEYKFSADLQKVNTENVYVHYIDLQNKMFIETDDVNLNIQGKWADPTAHGNVKIQTGPFVLKILNENPYIVRYTHLKGSFKGSLEEVDRIEGSLDLAADNVCFESDTIHYLNRRNIQLFSNFKGCRSSQDLTLQNTQLTLDQHQLLLDGTAHRDTTKDDLELHLHYKTGNWQIQKVLALIPDAFLGNALDNITLDGLISLGGQVSGHLNDHQKPIITSDVHWSNGSFAMQDFPFSFNKINTTLHLNLNLDKQTDLQIKQLSAYSGANAFSASGSILDLLGEMLFDLNLAGNLHLADFHSLLPDKLTRLDGNAKANMHTHFNYEQLSNLSINQWKAEGTIDFTDLDIVYDDSLQLNSPALDLQFKIPASEYPYNIDEWIFARIKAATLYGSKTGLGDVTGTDGRVEAYLNDLTDSTLTLKLGATYQFSSLIGKTDSMHASLNQPHGTFSMPATDRMNLEYAGGSFFVNVGDDTQISGQELTFNAASRYSEKGSNLLTQWNPTATMNLKEGMVQNHSLPYPLTLSQLQANIDPHKCHIAKGNGQFGNSLFSLSGQISNIDDFFTGQDLLRGTLDLNSDFIDLNQLIDVVSGFGVEDSLLAEKPLDSEKDPFMVPFGMDIRMNTHIQRALYEDTYFRNIGGHLDLKDGTLILEEMGLTHDAARMQLTAMYKSPRKNHLFLGLDFHLLDIKIDQLIDLIPDVDTILPMLKSFAGNAEFHFAIETYLKSNYDLKYSTLRGAAAINGHDLVVLDNETYRIIAKKLMFNKNTQNRIDSLSAEVTIFKNEIDVYPFLVSLDKYQAILSGRHNLDYNYHYNISLIKPLRIGLDIIGTDKRRFKVGKPKYSTLFRPEKQNVVEQNVMQLKKRIHEALKANVKSQPTP